MSGSHAAALALVRPAGAPCRAAGDGLRLYNNVAVAAAHADASARSASPSSTTTSHHGNGDAAYLRVESERALMRPRISFRFTRNRRGDGRDRRSARAGFTVNLPISAGAVSDDYRLGLRRVLLPVARQLGAGPRASSPPASTRTSAIRFAHHAIDDRDVCGDDDGAEAAVADEEAADGRSWRW